jgi:hypothetical protein
MGHGGPVDRDRSGMSRSDPEMVPVPSPSGLVVSRLAMSRSPEAVHAGADGGASGRPEVVARAGWGPDGNPVWKPVRRVLLAAYLVAFVWVSAKRGIAFDRETVIGWICGALLVTSVGRPPRRVLQLVLDWIPLVLVYVVYDLTRGLADELGTPIQVTPQIRADELLFGGHIPTIWLQEHLFDPRRVHTWELFLSLTYASYFIAPFLVAGVLWARDRATWKKFVRRLITLQYASVFTYVLVPAAPPWWAARNGYIGDVHRFVSRGWSVVDLDFAQALINKGRATANPVAALPSLHAAVPMLLCLWFWPRVGPVGKALALAYPLAMGFTLVITAEHYAFDVLLGFAYAAIVVVGWNRIERWREGRSAGAIDLDLTLGAPVAVEATPVAVPVGTAPMAPIGEVDGDEPDPRAIRSAAPDASGSGPPADDAPVGPGTGRVT